MLLAPGIFGFYDPPMLIVSGSMTIHPDDLDKATALVEPLAEATRAEAGCLAYGFWIHPSTSGSVHLYEEWEDQASMDAHNASEHLATFMISMADLRITDISIYVHEVATTTKFM